MTDTGRTGSNLTVLVIQLPLMNTAYSLADFVCVGACHNGRFLAVYS